MIACARRTSRLEAMGFQTRKVDLTTPEAAHPEFWKTKTRGVTHMVNAAGVLNSNSKLAKAVHQDAPAALAGALPENVSSVLISAVGIDNNNTVFSQQRLAGEEIARLYRQSILRPGLVLADTSYGGSSLARALAALPFITPLVGNGQQMFNPIHATDLAIIVEHLLVTPQPATGLKVGGPERIIQKELLDQLRSWLGFRPARHIKLPIGLAKSIRAIGDAMRLGPISRTSVRQLEEGVLSTPVPDLPAARGFKAFLNARPAGTQDLWHARLYLMRPLARIVLGLMWLVSGILGLMLP